MCDISSAHYADITDMHLIRTRNSKTSQHLLSLKQLHLRIFKLFFAFFLPHSVWGRSELLKTIHWYSLFEGCRCRDWYSKKSWHNSYTPKEQRKPHMNRLSGNNAKIKPLELDLFSFCKLRKYNRKTGVHKREFSFCSCRETTPKKRGGSERVRISNLHFCQIWN